MANPWFRLYGGEFLSDNKILALDGNERSIWITLLCLASQTNGIVKFISEKRLIELAGIKLKGRYTDVLKKFENYGMVTISNGSVTVNNWAKRQYSEGYARVLAHRETNLKRKRNGNVTPYTDTDTESDTEKEKIPFSEFWNLYPKKAEKKKAEDKWNRLSKETQELILKDLPRRKLTESWKKGFILNPMTYLNGERWNDEIAIQAGSAPPQKKFCVECKKELGSNYVDGGHGRVCGECFGKVPVNKRVESLKAALMKTLKP